MHSWPLTRGGAVALSWLALLAFLTRTFLDWAFVVPGQTSDVTTIAISAVAWTAIFGAWIRAIGAAGRGSRRGLAGALFALVLPVGLGVGTLVAFCPSPCQTAWPLMEVATWVGLVAGLAAAASVARVLFRVPPGP